MTLTRLSSVLFGTFFLASTAQAAEPSAAAPMRVHDLASQFVEVWDRNAASPDAFVQDFKATIGTRFPQFYGIERYAGSKTQQQRDRDIAAAHADFPAMRAAYVRKVAKFSQDLPAHILSFKEVFPDYVPKKDVYFIHSLGEMDGGMRTMGGQAYFIFGADQMVKIHGDGDEAAFFHHELFHDYHAPGCKVQRVWNSLWGEGLATYVSKRMNPTANDAELLLDFPHGLVQDTQRQLPRALEDLHAKLDSDDAQAYSGLFLRRGDQTGLPARRGYYLGYLVAEEAGKRYDLRQLAKLDCEAARKVVFAAVDSLRGAHPARK